MSHTLAIVLTVFGLIAVGYAVARLRLIGPGSSEGLADFVFNVGIPVLLFRTLATADFGELSPWRLWGAYFAGVALVWAVGHVLVRRLFGRDARAGVVAGVSASFANTVLIGIPLAEAAFGAPGLVVALVIVSIHLPVMMLASLIAHGWAVRVDGASGPPSGPAAIARAFVLELARNPIVIGIVAGGLWRLTGLPLSGVPAGIVDAIARTAGPLALIAAGIGLARYGLSGEIRPAVLVTFLKLVVMPGLVLAAGLVLRLPILVAEVATLVAACPTGVNAFLIASRFGVGQGLASNVTSLSTAVALATVTAWIAAMRLLLG